MTRLVAWMVMVSLLLAMLRLAITAGLIALAVLLVWFLIKQPSEGLALLALVAALALARFHPLPALILLIIGVGLSSLSKAN